VSGSRRVVAVVGGGFAGTACAAHLLGRLAEGDRVVLFETSRLGAGVAYASPAREHVLNVTADRMSLFPDDPQDFVRYLEDAGIAIGAVGFAPRGLYGAYVAERLEAAVARSPARFEHRAARVEDLEQAANRWRVTSSAGVLEADRVVLATGHGPPVVPAALTKLVGAADPRVVVDPYASGALEAVAPEETLLLVGTGLTAVDVLQSFVARKHAGVVHALSPSGRWPKAHLREVRWAGAAVTLAAFPEERTIAALERWFDAELARARHEGIPWQALVDALRPHTAVLWSSLADADRARFLRSDRRAWNRLRHRMPASQAEAIRASTAEGRVITHAGTLAAARVAERGVTCTWASAGDEGARVERTFDRVVLCAGRCADVTTMGAPWPSLLRRGLALRSSLGVGVVTDREGNLLDARGEPNGLVALGGLLRPALFESTAVPELARQAAALAKRLAA
jgi:uncharacterized NAD(P)/FAD-binding protein YdhS